MNYTDDKANRPIISYGNITLYGNKSQVFYYSFLKINITVQAI